jgi:photosystem II stability/assembly factor-like uncharacterized protein
MKKRPHFMLRKQTWKITFLPLLWLGCIVFGPVQLLGQSWVSIGPEGGAVAQLLQDPANNNNLYLLSGNYPAKFIKSTNKGSSWNEIAQVQGSAASFAINGKKPSELYMGGLGNFSVSTNTGSKWTSNNQSGKSYYDVSVDSFNQNILYGCGYDYSSGNTLMAYFKSTDKGTSWTSSVMNVTMDYGSAYALAVDPKIPKNIWIGGYIVSGGNVSPKVFKTTNGGTNWSDVTGTIGGTVEDILIDSTNVKRVLVLTMGGVFRSTDNGSTWIQNSGYVYGYKLAQDPKNKNILYVGAYNRIFKSTDGGSNWQDYSSGLTTASTCNGICVDRGNSQNVFYGGNIGFYKSTDGGQNWNAFSSGLLLSSVTSVKIAKGTPQTLYAAVSGDGLYMTTNPMGKAQKPEAVTWTRLPTFYDCHNLTDLQVSPTDSKVLYAFEGGG